MPELKVTNSHLKRDAYVYVRQSTARQVLENSESTERQYALADRAIALGLSREHIHVIDCDLGKTGTQAIGRGGFQQLVNEVALDKAGMVLGLEVSRLARNSADWHRLLELCALTGTLILDDDGIYDPASFNDRLLLGLKGEMSQAELHFLKARMRGGVLNKAQRGELEMGPPVGLVYLPNGTIALDPDQEVQSALRLLFATFERTGSAMRTLQFFAPREFVFLVAFAGAPTRENYSGAFWITPGFCRFCTIPAMRAPSFMAAHEPAESQTASTSPSAYRVINGST